MRKIYLHVHAWNSEELGQCTLTIFTNVARLFWTSLHILISYISHKQNIILVYYSIPQTVFVIHDQMYLIREWQCFALVVLKASLGIIPKKKQMTVGVNTKQLRANYFLKTYVI